MKLNLNNMFGNKPKEPSFKENSYNEDARTPSRNSGGQDKILTLISDGCKFEGNLSSPSTTKIDGHIVGNLRGESGIIIGEKGIVEGNVNAVDVVIYGTVKGNIKAHKLELKRSGTLDGDVLIEELVTECGSKFNGSAKMGDRSKSNIIDMKVDIKNNDIDLNSDGKTKENMTFKEKPVLKFH